MPDDPSSGFAKLPRGASALDRASVAAAHRQRLERAVIEVASELGYANTAVADIARAARVSTNAFYAQYRTKEACFQAAWEGALAAVRLRLERAAGDPPPPDDLREALARVISAFVDALATDPARGRALVTSVLAIGPEGPDLRRRVIGELQRSLGAAQAAAPPGPVVSNLVLSLVAGGVVQVVEQRLAAAKPRWPRSLVDDLTGWAMSYASDTPLEAPEPDPRRFIREVPPEPAELVRLPRGQSRLPRAFVVQHQRRRILHAVGALAREHGYAGVTVPAIAARAHISNRTVYDHFADKQEAFLALYDTAFARLFARAFYAAAVEREWTAAVREGVRAWLGFLAAEPELARFALSDALTSPEIAPRVEEAYQAFAHLLSLGRENAQGQDVPELVAYALAGGIAWLVGGWVVDGRAAELPSLAPLVSYLALAPFVGDRTAHIVAA
jgi:AcrR family transcriptional regulator